LCRSETPLEGNDSSQISLTSHLSAKFEQVEGGRDALALLFVECDELRGLAQTGREELDLALLTDYMRELRVTNTWGKRVAAKSKSSVNIASKQMPMDAD
jgi:hypothetical protein